MAVQLRIPTSNIREFQCPTLSSTLDIVSLFNFSYSNGFIMVSHVDLSLNFSNDVDYLFMCLCAKLLFSFEKCQFKLLFV
jgi:hypothetical protein